jgi:hypothetical protein
MGGTETSMPTRKSPTSYFLGAHLINEVELRKINFMSGSWCKVEV